jgi:hypothetical protein
LYKNDFVNQVTVSLQSQQDSEKLDIFLLTYKGAVLGISGSLSVNQGAAEEGKETFLENVVPRAEGGK